jgi:SAM-dependent methyltransferase
LASDSKISSATVRDDFNDLLAVMHYTRAAHDLGLWASERLLIERYFPDRDALLLEAGCGAGRVTIGLWGLGYTRLTAFDFAEELIDQARSLAIERNATSISFYHADATTVQRSELSTESNGEVIPGARKERVDTPFDGALFMFNGLMQIPGRECRREALRRLHALCAPGAPLLFTTHDRDSSPTEQIMWRLEAGRWERGEQDPRLIEFGDRYFSDETGRTFMHLPSRAEILADLASAGWTHTFDARRSEIAQESMQVVSFSDECRFWVAHSAPSLR